MQLYVGIFKSNKKVRDKKEACILKQVESTSLFCPKGGGTQMPGGAGVLAPHLFHKSPSPVSETPKVSNVGDSVFRKPREYHVLWGQFPR